MKKQKELLQWNNHLLKDKYTQYRSLDNLYQLN